MSLNNLTQESVRNSSYSNIRGKASAHLVKQSTITSKYLFPKQVVGKGPSMSICILSNGAPTLYTCNENFSFPEGPFFAIQTLQDLHQSSISCLQVAQENRFRILSKVLLIPK